MCQFRLIVCFAFILGMVVSGAQASPNPPDESEASSVAFTFGGAEYVHRWSQSGQHEFTPVGDKNLEFWRDMVTVNVLDTVTDGDQLAELANNALSGYQQMGGILKTDSKPRTDEHPAEHLLVALLGNQELLEAVFARFMLVDDVGVGVVYSHRIYGEDIAEEMGRWLETHGPQIDQALMEWQGLPALETLRALPQGRVSAPGPS